MNRTPRKRGPDIVQFKANLAYWISAIAARTKPDGERYLTRIESSYGYRIVALARPDKEFFESVKTSASAMGVNPRSIIRARAKFEELGVLVHSGNKAHIGESKAYWVRIPPWIRWSEPEMSPVLDETQVTISTDTVDRSGPRGGHLTNVTPIPEYPEQGAQLPIERPAIAAAAGPSAWGSARRGSRGGKRGLPSAQDLESAHALLEADREKARASKLERQAAQGGA